TLLKKPDTRLAINVLGGFVLGAIALFFGITYVLSTDLTRGARYNFVYFPAVIGLVGAALSISWNAAETSHAKHSFDTQSPQPISKLSSLMRTNGKPAVALIWLMGLLSGITVVGNLGYQKYYRPDLLVPAIQQASQAPILIATTHNTLVQTGEIMGLAWEFKRATDSKESPLNPQFLLAHQDQEQCVSVQGVSCRASTTLQKTLAQLPRPLDLWLINFKAPMEPDTPNCFAEENSQYQTSVDGYSAQLYHCLTTDSQASQ
ncbi:MAG: glycosyltransferase, partial [Coleofasciculus sp. S288]|nr:glycosyltransferase [Coleofasciculus sp. S288]